MIVQSANDTCRFMWCFSSFVCLCLFNWWHVYMLLSNILNDISSPYFIYAAFIYIIIYIANLFISCISLGYKSHTDWLYIYYWIEMSTCVRLTSSGIRMVKYAHSKHVAYNVNIQGRRGAHYKYLIKRNCWMYIP